MIQLAKEKAATKNVIEGLVTPNKWDNSGKIIGIAIQTDKEEIYLVAHNRMESELLSYLHRKVKIQGKIIERLDGSKNIHVSSFQTILDESNYDQEKQQYKP